jgi:hypothetical protein
MSNDPQKFINPISILKNFRAAKQKGHRLSTEERRTVRRYQADRPRVLHGLFARSQGAHELLDVLE